VQKSLFHPPTQLALKGSPACSLFGPVGPAQQQIDNGIYSFTAVKQRINSRGDRHLNTEPFRHLRD